MEGSSLGSLSQYAAEQKSAMPYPAGQIVGATPTPAAPTLVRALALIDDLNKRLYSLHSQANEIASAVGGPYPIGENGKDAAPPSSAMQRLNDAIQTAHGTVNNLEGALSAMRRALGG